MKTILLCVPILACLFLLHALWRIFWHRQRVRVQAEATVILAACDHLHSLVKHLLQHRALSCAWLAGDATYGERIASKQCYIEAVFPALQPLLAVESNQFRPSLTANELALFRFRWRALVDDLAGLSPDESTHRHGQLLGNLVDWLKLLGDNLGETLSVLPGSAKVPQGVVSNYAQRLPVLADLLGQVRVWLAMMTVGKRDAAVVRVQLKMLLGKVATLLEQSRAAGGEVIAQAQAVAAINAMQEILRRELLESGEARLDCDTLLSTASLASDTVFLWIWSSAHALYGSFAEAPEAAATAATSTVPALGTAS